MSGYDYFIRLLVLVGFIVAGILATVIFSGILMLLSGVSLDDMVAMQQSGSFDFSAGMTRWLLAGQHLLVFILPGLAFGLLVYRKKLFSGLDLGVAPGWPLGICGILFLLAAYPLVNLSFLVNEALPLPAWAGHLEEQAAETLEIIIHMPTPWIFLANLIIIGLLPGIGEELIFRGILQNQLGLWSKKPIAAIWITAMIFSAIHLQFEGFLPRMVLGLTLGYLYYWSGNLWVPVIAHAFNNAMQVALIYFTGIDPTAIDQQSSESLQWWMPPLGIVFMYILYRMIIQNRKRDEPQERIADT